MFARRLLSDPGLPKRSPTTSYWQQHYEESLPDIQSKSLATHRDIVIIGSGITGCSTALTLLETEANSENPPSVTVLEARGLCSGATGRNGGHVKFNAVSEYADHKARLGHEAAVHLVRFSMSHYQAIKSAAERLGVLEIGEVREVTAITSIMDPTKVAHVKASFHDFEQTFPDLKGSYTFVEGLDETRKIFSISGAYAAILGPAGAAWPYRLISGIFKTLLEIYKSRFSIETHTPALDIEKDSDASYPFKIRTPRGVIRARHVIHCTEAYTSHLLPRLRGIIWPLKGQMTVQKPGKLLAGYHGEFSWSFWFPGFFDYATQNAKTGEIFIGGGDVSTEAQDYPQMGTTSDDLELELNKIHLSGVLPIIFKDQDAESEAPRIKASWTGIMGFSIDRYPLLGKLPSQALDRPAGTDDGCEWIAAGFGGYGMVNSWLSGDAVAKLLLTGKVPETLPPNYLLTAERYAALEQTLEAKITTGTNDGTAFKSLL